MSDDDVGADAQGDGMREVKHCARQLLSAIGGAAILAFVCPSVLAQCAMCRAAINSSTDAVSIANSMNLAVLVLLIPPVGLFCALFVVAYRYRKAPDEAMADAVDEQQRAPRGAGVLESKRDVVVRRGRIRGDNDGQAGIAEAT